MSAKYWYQNGKRIVEAGVHILCESYPCGSCGQCVGPGKWWVRPYIIRYLWDSSISEWLERVWALDGFRECVSENDSGSYWSNEAVWNRMGYDLEQVLETATGTIPTSYGSFFDKEYSFMANGYKAHYSDDVLLYTEDFFHAFKFAYIRCYDCCKCDSLNVQEYYVPAPPADPS